MCPIKYYTIMLKSKASKFLRLQLVLYAKQHSISKASKDFNVTRKTIYKWLYRYNKYGISGLDSLSRRPKHFPKETPKHIKDKVIKAKLKYKNLGAYQVKILENLPVCPDTIRKIWRNAGFSSRKRTKKYITKLNLRNVKKKWKLFQQIDVDVKHLNDIPNYFIPMKKFNLPIYQYTARDVTSGLVFWAFAYEYSISNSVSFIKYLIHHLISHNVDLSNITIQTDNGSEFCGAWNSKHPSEFTTIIQSFGMHHLTIPQRAHTFQADVETFHNIEEVEFFDIESFSSIDDFINKTFSYQLFFNLSRPNTYKENQTPWDIVQRKNPNIPKSICMLKPIILDKMIKPSYRESVYHVFLDPFFYFLRKF